MQFENHFNKDNLHHAYLIEGNKDSVVPLLLSYLNTLEIQTTGNPDVYTIHTDSFKIEDARNLKSLTSEKSFSNDEGSKKVFIVSANSFLLEAQNSLLKVFEEPIANTHFFIITPSTQIFIPTLLSRFHVIKNKSENDVNNSQVEDFIKLPLQKRIDFLKEFLATDEDEEEGSETDSPRAKALRFLDSLELVLHSKYSASMTTFNTFEQIFNARKYLRQPGSSAKMLMESVALSIPEKIQ